MRVNCGVNPVDTNRVKMAVGDCKKRLRMTKRAPNRSGNRTTVRHENNTYTAKGDRRDRPVKNDPVAGPERKNRFHRKNVVVVPRNKVPWAASTRLLHRMKKRPVYFGASRTGSDITKMYYRGRTQLDNTFQRRRKNRPRIGVVVPFSRGSQVGIGYQYDSGGHRNSAGKTCARLICSATARPRSYDGSSVSPRAMTT